MAKVKFKIEGMDKLQKSLKKLGEVPQKHVSSIKMPKPTLHILLETCKEASNLLEKKQNQARKCTGLYLTEV